MQAVMVDMVDALAGAGVHNHPVHLYILLPATADCNGFCCVVASGGPYQVPFVFCKAGVVFGVYDSVFSLCKWNSSEGVAVVEATERAQSENEESLDKNGN
jgi:hypothetical protein